MSKFLLKYIQSFRLNKSGISSIEYSLAAVVLGIVVSGSITLLGADLDKTYDCITNSVANNPCNGASIGGTEGFDTINVANQHVPWDLYSAGDEIGEGWSVTHGQVNTKDLSRFTIGGKSSGTAIDIDGNGLAGTITKSFETEIGQEYTVSFEYINTAINDSGYNPNWDENKKFSVQVADQLSNFEAISTTNWATGTVTFTATSNSTDLSFASGSIGNRSRTGAYLDQVIMTKN